MAKKYVSMDDRLDAIHEGMTKFRSTTRTPTSDDIFARAILIRCMGKIPMSFLKEAIEKTLKEG